MFNFNIYIYIKNNIYIKRDFLNLIFFYTVECFLTRDLLDGNNY